MERDDGNREEQGSQEVRAREEEAGDPHRGGNRDSWELKKRGRKIVYEVEVHKFTSLQKKAIVLLRYFGVSVHKGFSLMCVM